MLQNISDSRKVGAQNIRNMFLTNGFVDTEFNKNISDGTTERTTMYLRYGPQIF